MKNNQLKFLANLAKQRLKTQNYSEAPVVTKNRVSNYFIQNALALKKIKAETSFVTIKEKEDIEFIEKVKLLVESDCYNPLGVLCDKDYFDSLDVQQKQFYILQLSEKYNKVKNELMCG